MVRKISEAEIVAAVRELHKIAKLKKAISAKTKALMALLGITGGVGSLAASQGNAGEYWGDQINDISSTLAPEGQESPEIEDIMGTIGDYWGSKTDQAGEAVAEGAGDLMGFMGEKAGEAGDYLGPKIDSARKALDEMLGTSGNVNPYEGMSDEEIQRQIRDKEFLRKIDRFFQM